MRVFSRISIAALSAAIFFTSVAPTATRASDASALLAKHVAFMGWKLGDGSVPGLDLQRQNVRKDGKVIGTARELRLGMLYRRDYTEGKDSGATGFTGRAFWKTSSNGFIVPFLGDDARYYLAVDVLFNEGTSELPAAIVGEADINGTPVSIVHVTMKSAFPIDLYVDPQSGAYLRAVIDPGGSSETTYEIHSYLDLAPGKKYIGSWSIDKSSDIYSYAKSAVVSDIPLARLHPPSPTALWTFANPNPFKIEVTPTRFSVDAVVNGVLGHFILDTGDSSITLTDAFAERARVKTIGSSIAWGIGGIVKTLVRKVDTITIGGNTLSNVVIDTYTNSYTRRTMDFGDSADTQEFDGLLGFDFLAGAIVTLDTAAQTMRIQDPSTTELDTRSGINVLVDLNNGTPRVPMVIDRKVTVDATLDSGDAASVMFSPDLRYRGISMAIDDSQLNSHLGIGGVGGSEEDACATVDSISLGPIVYQSPPACESASFSGREALVGFDFLRQFNYIFDYPQSTIIMTPHT